jgi:hypothetical protein
VWGTRLVWGTGALALGLDGTLLYGEDIDWEQVTADRLVWGTLSDALRGTSRLADRFTPVF